MRTFANIFNSIKMNYFVRALQFKMFYQFMNYFSLLPEPRNEVYKAMRNILASCLQFFFLRKNHGAKYIQNYTKPY